MSDEHALLVWEIEIDNLIGMEEFKALMKQWMTLFPLLKKTQTEKTFLNRVYLFSIADGEGFSEQLKMIRRTFLASGIPDLIRSYREVKMPYLESTEKSKKDATPASLAIEELRKQNAFRSERFPALIAVDIREWVGKTHLPHFRVVLEKLFEGNNAPFIFRVPLLEEKKLRQIESDIADIRNVQTVVTNQTTIDEYLLYAHRIAKERNAAIAKEAEELLAKCFIEERNRGNFRGFCTVEKIVDEILYRKILEMAEK